MKCSPARYQYKKTAQGSELVSVLTAKAGVTSDSDSLADSSSDSPPVIIQREVDVAESVPRSDARSTVLVDGDVAKVSEIDDERSVVASETVGSVRVTSAAG